MSVVLPSGTSVVLLNGNVTPRVRNSEGCTVLLCGCAFSEREWIQMCKAHYAAHAEMHERAALDHQPTMKEGI